MTPEERAEAHFGKHEPGHAMRYTVLRVADAIREAVEEEREACAKLLDNAAITASNWGEDHTKSVVEDLAEDIRERGK